MARYTAKDVEKIIAGSSNLAENKKGGYAREAGTGRSYTAADVDAVISRSKPKQSEAGRTSSASSSAVKRTQSTGSNMTDDQILERIRKYTQKGYQMTGAEQEEMRSITDAVNKATSDAINNYADGQWDFSKGVLPGGTEISGNDYQLLLKYQQDQADAESAKGGRNYLADESFIKNFLYNIPGAKQVVKAVDKYIDPLLGTNLVDSEAMANEVAQMQEDQKAASTAGALGGNLAGYYVGSQFVNAIPALGNATGQAANTIANAATRGQMSQQAVQQGASHLQNVLGDMTLDVTLDTIPQLVDAAENGASAGDIAGLAAESTLQNLALNAGGELFGMAAPAALNRLRRVNDSVSDRAAQRIPFLRDQTPQADSAEIPRLRDRITQRGDLSTLGEQVARSGDNMAETASRVTADAITETAARQTDDFIDMSNVNGMDALDFAEAPKRITSMPKTTVPKSSSFSKLDNEVSKLVRMYGDDSLLNDLDSFRTNIVEFENTGSMQAADNASHALQRLDDALQGRTYTDGGTRTKSGAQKRAGTTYTYGREYPGINDLVEDAQQQFDDIFESEGTFERIPQPEDIDDVSERISNPISAERRNSDRAVYRPQNDSTSEDEWNQLLEGTKQFFGSGDPDLDYLVRAQRRAARNGEYVTRTATNTLTNSDVVKNNPELQTILRDEIESGRMNFRTVTENESIRSAKEALSKDLAGETDRLMSSNWKTAQDFDGGMMLLKSAADSGDHDAVREIARKIASEGHDAGVRLQALEKYSRTAEGAIAKAQNILDAEIKDWAAASPKEAQEAKRVADEILGRLDEMLQSRNVVNGDEIQKAVNDIISQSSISGKVDAEDATEIARLLQNGYADQVEGMVNSILATQQYGISDETIDQVISIFDEANKFPENSRRRVNLEERAYALLANEVTTSSWRDKWDAWRYLSMLSKPATHERNLIGNVGMNVVSGVKNNLAATMEAVLDRIAPNGIQRTRSVLNPLSGTDRGLISAAADDAENVAYRALSGSKYNVTGGIKGQAKAFRSGPGRAIQWLADKNSGLLEAEDWLGLKAKYSTSLAGYLKANGLGADALNSADEVAQNLVQRGREFAIKEAQRATFHEQSTLADALSQFSRSLNESNKKADNAIGMLIEGIVPFKKTPINIVKTAGRYSPLNIANAVVQGVQAVKSGSYTASEVLDSLAAGLTGTGIMALGAYLGSQGIIRGSGTGDENQDAFDELQGAQNYSFVTDDGSYTIDWAAPSVLPLLVGVELQQSMSDGGVDSSDLINAITSIADPIVETTMMSGISDALSAVQYADDDADVLSTFAANALTGYATQGIPSSLGAITRAIDNTRRTSYSDSTGAAGELEYTVNSTRNKIPFLSDDAPEYRDAWGRTQENFEGGGGLLGNLAYQFFSPGYYSADRTTENDTYLQEIYDYTEDPAVLPKNISRSYGSGQKMTGEEYSEAQRIAGETSYELVEALRENHSGVTSSGQADIISDIYSLSKAIALQDVVGKDMSEANAKLNDIYQSSGAQGLIDYLVMDARVDSGASGTKQADVIDYLKESGFDDGTAGDYLVTSGKVSLEGNNGKVYDRYGGEGLYQYIQMNNYDFNGDGRKTKYDVIKYLDRSDLTPAQKAYFFRLKYPKSENPYS